MKIYNTILKRIMDFILASIALLLLSPILFISILVLMFTNNGKPFFFQLRPGLNEKVFKIFKLKTMNDRKDDKGEFLPFEKRVTRFGTFLRKYSIDEIPQLFNVLIGDMSLVGPRPLIVQYLPLYNETQKKRHSVRPGITGWAQVNYPYGQNIEDSLMKLRYDLYYIKHRSLFLDINIVMKTLSTILFARGQ